MSLQLVESCIVPFSFQMRFRVASSPRSSGLANNASPGCPVLRILRPRWRRIHELPRTFSPFGCAGNGLSSCPDFPSSTPPVLKLRVAPILRCLVAPIDEFPGCPVRCIFRLCRRWISEFPRISHPSAVPTGRFTQVALVPRSFGIADDEFSGCPEFPSSGTGWWISKFPRIAPSGFAIVDSSGCPKTSLLAPSTV